MVPPPQAARLSSQTPHFIRTRAAASEEGTWTLSVFDAISLGASYLSHLPPASKLVKISHGTVGRTLTLWQKHWVVLPEPGSPELAGGTPGRSRVLLTQRQPGNMTPVLTCRPFLCPTPGASATLAPPTGGLLFTVLVI